MKFCSSKLSQKTTLSFLKIYLVLIKKSLEVLDEPQDTQNIER